MNDLALSSRTALPETLRVLLAEYPKEAWAADPGFSGLVRFWLERHMMFRELLTLLTEETEAMRDGSRDPQAYRAALSRYGGHLVGNLHGHHQIEDQHYFPLLSRKDARLHDGFALLDADHYALDGDLATFTKAANAVLQTTRPDADSVAAFHDRLSGLDRLLDRHLTDEEELVVPVILKYGADGLG